MTPDELKKESQLSLADKWLNNAIDPSSKREEQEPEQPEQEEKEEKEDRDEHDR